MGRRTRVPLCLLAAVVLVATACGSSKSNAGAAATKTYTIGVLTDLTGFGWYSWVFVNVDPDGARAREGAAQTMGGNYDQDFREMVDNVAAAGTPDEVGGKLQDFVDAGARHFIFMPAAGEGDPDAIVDRLLGGVVPRLNVPEPGAG